MEVTFGKYRGFDSSALPSEYLEWCAERMKKVPPEIFHEAQVRSSHCVQAASAMYIIAARGLTEKKPVLSGVKVASRKKAKAVPESALLPVDASVHSLRGHACLAVRRLLNQPLHTVRSKHWDHACRAIGRSDFCKFWVDGSAKFVAASQLKGFSDAVKELRRHVAGNRRTNDG